MNYTLNGRPIEIELAGTYDEPMVQCGNFADGDMEDLSDDECDEALGENHGAICEDMLGTAIDRAHDMADIER